MGGIVWLEHKMKLKIKILKILRGLWSKHRRDVQETWYNTYKAGQVVVCWYTALIPAFGKQTQVAVSLKPTRSTELNLDSQGYAKKLPAGNVLNMQSWESLMDQWNKAFAQEPRDLSFTPGNHIMEGEISCFKNCPLISICTGHDSE